MNANAIIDKNLNILISVNCESDAILGDNVNFVTSNESNPEAPQRAPIHNQTNASAIEATPVTTSQKTCNLPIPTRQLHVQS